jgi:hypothetical protein
MVETQEIKEAKERIEQLRERRKEIDRQLKENWIKYEKAMNAYVIGLVGLAVVALLSSIIYNLVNY